MCCGSGSGSDLGKVLVPFPVPVPAAVPVPALVPVPDSGSILAQFSKYKNKMRNILPFQCQKQLIFQKVGRSFLIFFSNILC